ncbi:MAG: hypothetical protein ACFFDF_23950, partial [Candidatus Odinarchaeota archaeon]
MVLTIGRIAYPKKGMNKRFSKKDEKDIPYLDDFLSNYSSRMGPMIRNKVIFFNKWVKLRFIRFPIKNILDFKYDPHVLTFFKIHINKRRVKIGPRKGEYLQLVTKEKWRIAIKKYYDFIIKIYQKQGKEFINPVPDSDLYKFDKPKLDLKKVRIKSLQKKITYKHALKLLNHCYFNDFETYIALGFLVWSNPRIEELSKVQVSNIEIPDPNRAYDLEIEFEGKIHKINHLRFFLTELKRTKKEDKWGVYIYPKFFVNDLKLYLEQKKLIYHNDPYLFPSPMIRNYHVHQSTIRRKIKKIANLLNIKVKIT